MQILINIIFIILIIIWGIDIGILIYYLKTERELSEERRRGDQSKNTLD